MKEQNAPADAAPDMLRLMKKLNSKDVLDGVREAIGEGADEIALRTALARTRRFMKKTDQAIEWPLEAVVMLAVTFYFDEMKNGSRSIMNRTR